VKEAPRQTIRRSVDEPRLEIGETTSIKEGLIGVVLARYTPAGEENQICYIVEVISHEGEKRQAQTQ
jgi:hypothetical protein